MLARRAGHAPRASVDGAPYRPLPGRVATLSRARSCTASARSEEDEDGTTCIERGLVPRDVGRRSGVRGGRGRARYGIDGIEWTRHGRGRRRDDGSRTARSWKAWNPWRVRRSRRGGGRWDDHVGGDGRATRGRSGGRRRRRRRLGRRRLGRYRWGGRRGRCLGPNWLRRHRRYDAAVRAPFRLRRRNLLQWRRGVRLGRVCAWSTPLRRRRCVHGRRVRRGRGRMPSRG